jgi:hypothetical protein
MKISNKNLSSKLPFAQQQGESDCGVACLLSVIRFHGGEKLSLLNS